MRAQMYDLGGLRAQVYDLGKTTGAGEARSMAKPVTARTSASGELDKQAKQKLLEEARLAKLLNFLFENITPDGRVYTAVELAKSYSLSANYFSMMRRGDRPVNDSAQRMAIEFFGVDPDYFDQKLPLRRRQIGAKINKLAGELSCAEISRRTRSKGVWIPVNRVAALRTGLARPTVQESAALELAFEIPPGPISGSKNAGDLVQKLLSGDATLIAAFAAATVSPEELAEFQRQLGAIASAGLAPRDDEASEGD